MPVNVISLHNVNRLPPTSVPPPPAGAPLTGLVGLPPTMPAPLMGLVGLPPSTAAPTGLVGFVDLTECLFH